MTRNIALYLTLGSLTAACGVKAEPPGAVARAIVNGEPGGDSYPHVLMVNSPSVCTATLVGARTLLLAAHCIAPGSDPKVTIAGEQWEVESVHPHPQFVINVTKHDIAVLRLVEAPPISPVPISSAPPLFAQEVTLAGYGSTVEGGAMGTLHVGKNRVVEVTDLQIVLLGLEGATTCIGDSGGPTWAVIDGQQVQVGVHSTILGVCGKESHDTRVDVFAHWIAEVASGDVSIDSTPSPVLEPRWAPPVTVRREVDESWQTRPLAPAADAGSADDAGPASSSGCTMSAREGGSEGAAVLWFLLLAVVGRRRGSRRAPTPENKAQ